jgi:hypothetical protein
MTVLIANRNYNSSGFVLPARFRVTKKKRNGRANRAFFYSGDVPASWLFRLLSQKQPCLYSLKYHNLFLDKRHAAKHLIYDRKTIEIWKRAIRKHIKPPYFFCLEVGIEGQLHAHVVAAIDAGLLGYRRGYDTRTVKIIKNIHADRHRVISYMYKTPVPLTVDFDDPNAKKLCDWQDRLDDYFDALQKIQAEGQHKDVPQLSDYVFS